MDLTHEWHGDSNVFVRPNLRLEAGEEIQGHTHNFNHLALFHTAWRVEAVSPTGKVIVRDFPKNSWALIHADWEHKMTTLPHEIEPHQQALLDTAMAVAEGRMPKEALLSAVSEWKQAHEAQPHTQWCVYAHRTPQGDVVQRYTGWPDGYG